MDIIIDIILMLIGALTKDGKKDASQPVQPARPMRQQIEQATRAKIQGRQARAAPLGPDPVFRNSGWCLAFAVCAMILLTALLGAWALGALPLG